MFGYRRNILNIWLSQKPNKTLESVLFGYHSFRLVEPNRKLNNLTPVEYT